MNKKEITSALKAICNRCEKDGTQLLFLSDKEYDSLVTTVIESEKLQDFKQKFQLENALKSIVEIIESELDENFSRAEKQEVMDIITKELPALESILTLITRVRLDIKNESFNDFNSHNCISAFKNVLPREALKDLSKKRDKGLSCRVSFDATLSVKDYYNLLEAKEGKVEFYGKVCCEIFESSSNFDSFEWLHYDLQDSISFDTSEIYSMELELNEYSSDEEYSPLEVKFN